MQRFLSPRELSDRAILNIKACPAAHEQLSWHSHENNTPNLFSHPCGTAHCYAGHIDLILGVPDEYKGEALYNDVKAALQLTATQWCCIVDGNNSIERISAFHKMYFVDGIFGVDGFDRDGYDIEGYDIEGYNEDGYDRYALDEDALDEDGE